MELPALPSDAHALNHTRRSVTALLQEEAEAHVRGDGRRAPFNLMKVEVVTPKGGDCTAPLY